MRPKLKWITVTATGSLVAQGSGGEHKVSVYGFKIVGASGGVGLAVFKTGGSGGTVLADCACVTGGADRDSLDGNGGFIEATDGVYVTITGTVNSAGILVDEGTVAG